MHVLGIDHRTFDSRAIAEFGRLASTLHSRLQAEPTVRGVVILATCARVEAYVDSSTFHGPQRVFIETLGLESRQLETHRGADALAHLFKVAAGLESAVVGEAQIAGQVRDSLLAARDRGATTRSLDLAFENALRVSRLARTRLGGQSSIAGAALDRLDGSGHFSYDTALVIGTGEFAQTCISELRERGTHVVWVHSPSGRALLPDGADHAVTSDELAESLALSDITVTASGHGRPVITPALVAQALSMRTTPLVLIDLAAAGDVAAEIDDDPDVLIMRIADVATSGVDSRAATSVVLAEARALFPRIEGRELDELIVRLRTHVHDVARAELGADPEPEAAEAIRRVTQALLHDPTQRAREAAANGELERYRLALETVFGMSPAVADAEGSAA